MAYERKDNSGGLFKNKKKATDSHPDFTGNGLIDGRDYWVSGWKKQTKDGDAYLSLSFRLKDEMPAKASSSKPSHKSADDDLSF
jgi:uncharacterized protein (DUF736 family)